MTKAALCTHCMDIVSPYREWRSDQSWRWCECDHMGVRWLNGDRGLIEVTALHGPDYVRVIGLNNRFLGAAIRPAGSGPRMAQDWRELHQRCADGVDRNYLFHTDQRACWALVVRVGESGDVTFVEYSIAKGYMRSPEPDNGS